MSDSYTVEKSGLVTTLKTGLQRTGITKFLKESDTFRILKRCRGFDVKIKVHTEE